MLHLGLEYIAKDYPSAPAPAPVLAPAMAKHTVRGVRPGRSKGLRQSQGEETCRRN